MLSQSFAVVAHRGVHQAPYAFLENTLPAFQAAARQKASVELDVMTTQDGHVVVHHDDQTGRVFQLPNQQKLVTQTTLQELQGAKPVSVRQQPVPAGTHIPLLSDVFEALPKTHFYVELKKPVTRWLSLARDRDQLEEKVVKMIREQNLYHRVTVVGFHPDTVRRVKDLDPQVRTAWNVELPSPWMAPLGQYPWFLRWVVRYAQNRVKADAIHPSYGMTTPKLVDIAHAAKLAIVPWVNQETPAQEQALFPKFLEMGVDGLITNTVDLLKEALHKHATTRSASVG